MKVISEISLRDFKFWSGGEDRAKNCTDEQLDKIESIMESAAPESGWTDDDINNFFWFDGITDTEDMINIASLDREDYISTDENGEEEFDEDLVYYDFSNWWNNMDDIEQVKEYRKHE